MNSILRRFAYWKAYLMQHYTLRKAKALTIQSLIKRGLSDLSNNLAVRLYFLGLPPVHRSN